MKSQDIKKYLATDELIQHRIEARYETSDLDKNDPDEAELIKEYSLIINKAKNASNWKRIRKYKWGGSKDHIFYDDDKLQGGVVREFWLEDTDHITVAVIEVNNKIVTTEDLSD
jgi:hypothetical protein